MRRRSFFEISSLTWSLIFVLRNVVERNQARGCYGKEIDFRYPEIEMLWNLMFLKKFSWCLCEVFWRTGPTDLVWRHDQTTTIPPRLVTEISGVENTRNWCIRYIIFSITEDTQDWVIVAWYRGTFSELIFCYLHIKCWQLATCSPCICLNMSFFSSQIRQRHVDFDRLPKILNMIQRNAEHAWTPKFPYNLLYPDISTLLLH